MPRKLSRDEQNEIVNEITSNFDSMESDEYERLYDQLDVDHQIEVDDAAHQYADDAIGTPHWRDGTNFEY